MSIRQPFSAVSWSILILWSLLQPSLAWAAEEIYRSADETGTPSFTDRPAGDARKVELPAPNIDSAGVPQGEFYSPPSAAVPAAAYESVRIVSPQAEATLRSNSGDLEVRVEVQPALQPQHWLLLRMDGQEMGELQKGGGFQLSNIDRGSHQLLVEVVDQDRAVIAQSSPVTIHLHRHSILFPPPSGSKPAPK